MPNDRTLGPFLQMATNFKLIFLDPDGPGPKLSRFDVVKKSGYVDLANTTPISEATKKLSTDYRHWGANDLVLLHDSKELGNTFYEDLRLMAGNACRTEDDIVNFIKNDKEFQAKLAAEKNDLKRAQMVDNEKATYRQYTQWARNALESLAPEIPKDPKTGAYTKKYKDDEKNVFDTPGVIEQHLNWKDFADIIRTANRTIKARDGKTNVQADGVQQTSGFVAPKNVKLGNDLSEQDALAILNANDVKILQAQAIDPALNAIVMNMPKQGKQEEVTPGRKIT
jgi:hypothetical protein